MPHFTVNDLILYKIITELGNSFNWNNLIMYCIYSLNLN